MYHITLIAVGKDHKGYIADGAAYYEKLLRKYVSLRRVTIAESKVIADRLEHSINEETDRILSSVPDGDFVVYLDVDGQHLTTEAFATTIEQHMNMGRPMTFIIGGSFGVDQRLLDRVDMRLSLSSMTTSHQLVRLFFLEQLFRVCDVIRGGKYHHS